MWNKIKGTVGKKELENYYDPSPDSDEEQLMWERRAARLNQMDRYVIVRNPNMGEIEFTVVKKENRTIGILTTRSSIPMRWTKSTKTVWKY